MRNAHCFPGMHALELTKTAWNALVTLEREHDTHSPRTDPLRILGAAYQYVNIASRVLETFGPEGDPGGPLEELAVMRSLLQDNYREYHDRIQGGL